jgi:predicted transport protein
MPLFEITNRKLTSLEKSNFALEKELQALVENNLETVFNCRLVKSEFPTGYQHSGRIDTLAISEDDNPVIIEYKKVESSELINQSLYYLAWLKDHQGDFERAVQKALGNSIEVDWSEIRVICIAPNYKKYDLYAVQMMGANIELWAYHLFQGKFLYLEKILHTEYSPSSSNEAQTENNSKNPVMVAAGKKAAATRATGVYTFEQHIEGKNDEIRDIAFAVQEFIIGLDSVIQEVPKKNYIAYKISQNIVCMEIQNHRIVLTIKLNPKEIANPPINSRDMTGKGHYGTGDFEISIKSMADFEIAKQYIEMAYQKIGG